MSLGIAAAVSFAFLLGLFGQTAFRQMVASAFQESYGTLVFKCDQAMREHFIAKARLAHEATDIAADILEEAEIALLDCHDYDVMRKKLLRLGLTEYDLSGMGLRAIEKRGTDIQMLVRIHEIRY